MREEANLVVALNVERDVGEELGAILHDVGEIANLKHLVTGLTLGGEDDTWVTTGRGGDFFDIDLLEHLLAASSLTALCHVGREARDELHKFLTLLLGLLILHSLLTESELRALIPEGVVAGEHANLAVVDVDDIGADIVEEVAVVADHDDSVGEVGKIILKPKDGVEVKIVGRLVEEEVVGVAEESLGEENLHLLLTAEVLHHHIMEILFYAESAKEVCCIALGCPATHFAELLFEFSYLCAILVVKIGLRVELIFALHILPQFLVTYEDSVKHGMVVKSEVILNEDREAFAWSHLDVALGRVELPRKDLEERRLTCTVGANDAVAVAGRELEVDILEERLLVKLNREIGYCNHLALGIVFYCLTISAKILKQNEIRKHTKLKPRTLYCVRALINNRQQQMKTLVITTGNKYLGPQELYR